MNKLDILEMLAYRRPANSKTEAAFIERYIDTIPGIYSDNFGNRLLIKPGARVMISCHTDTVHRKDGMQLVRKSKSGIVSLGKKERVSNCLGADDTAGIYAALHMIEAGIDASFVFHREEEIGGRGSDWLAYTYPEWLSNFDVCLALDRRGTGDIITSQMTGNCASDEFAWALGSALGMGHKPCPGIFTDSANYNRLIPECSNISIGYQREHTTDETLDTVYLEALIERLVQVDWGSLPIVRDPLSEPDDDWHGFGGSGGISLHSLFSQDSWDDWDDMCICFEREGDNLNCAMHSVGKKASAAS